MKEDSAFLLDVDQEFPHLYSSPTVEAIVAWTCPDAKLPPEPELLGLLKAALPDFSEIHVQQFSKVQAIVHSDGSSEHRQQQGWNGFRLMTPDKRWIVQVTRDGLTVSCLKPYEGWEALFGRACHAWDVYAQIVKPETVVRLGVRFINVVGIAGFSEIGKYLSQPPKCLESVEIPSDGFFYQSAHLVPGYPYRLHIVRAATSDERIAGTPLDLIVDIDVSTVDPFSASKDAIIGKLREIRFLKNRAFFAVMTKSAISKFRKKSTKS